LNRLNGFGDISTYELEGTSLMKKTPDVANISMPPVRPNAGQSSEAGFGVIDLSVTLLAAAILICASLIIFGKARARYELTQRAQTIAWQIERARSLAVRYNQTLTLGFSSQNTVFGLTCSNCDAAKADLASITIPTTVSLSAFPTMTIKGNGTITTANSSITLNDNRGRQITLTIGNSGRVTVGDITESSTSY